MKASATSAAPVAKRARVKDASGGFLEAAANDALEGMIDEIAEVIIRVMLFWGVVVLSIVSLRMVAYCVWHFPQNWTPPK
jgi:hypothetical protein